MQAVEAEIAIVGAGIAGIAAAFHLCIGQGRTNLVLLDAGPPMGLTSAQSGENYRDWWPHPVMADFTRHSIDLMERLAREAPGGLPMSRRGYALATRHGKAEDLVAGLLAGYGTAGSDAIRIRDGRDTARGLAPYEPPQVQDWRDAPGGVDVITDRALIARHFPQFDPAVATVLHIRRAGDVDGAQLGQHMLDRVKAAGGRLIRGRVCAIDRAGPFDLTVENGEERLTIRCEVLVNAAGPFAGQLAALLDVRLPLANVLQQKIAFEDRAGAVPRAAPFSVDLDPQHLDWTAEERALLAEGEDGDWLTGRFPGGVHCRPEGGGSWVKLGWAYNRQEDAPEWTPSLDPRFPELVLRGACALVPALKAYYGRLPGRLTHYGGYYTMTRENWPLIGPMGPPGAFMVSALSGFGTMAACAAGELCANWITGRALPPYAAALGLARYDDARLMAELDALQSTGVL